MSTENSTQDDKNNYKGLKGIRRAFATPSALTLLFFGIGSGLPFLLVGYTLSTWLRDAGLALGTIGLISFASFFYVLKFAWAPIIDRFPLPFLGRRRGWLAVSQILLMLSLIGMALTNPTTSLNLFIAFIALAAFAGATQDTLVDAYRIEIAPIEAQAALAATYILGYRVGLIASGAVALGLAQTNSWEVSYLCMAAIMTLPLTATLLSKEPDIDKQRIREVNIQQAFILPFRDFFQRNGIMLALALLLFVGLFKLPDQMIGVMAGPFYLDSGFTKGDIATVSKLYGVWIGIAGAFLGGIALAAFSTYRMLFLAALVVALSNLAYLLMAHFPSHLWAFFVTITADNLSQGFAGVIIVAFMSSLTDKNFTATQYALLASLANLPGKFIGGVSGFIVESTSYSAFFILSTLSVVPTVLLLWWLKKRIDN